VFVPAEQQETGDAGGEDDSCRGDDGDDGGPVPPSARRRRHGRADGRLRGQLPGLWLLIRVRLLVRVQLAGTGLLVRIRLVPCWGLLRVLAARGRLFSWPHVP
jgi:hypothetical protein